MEEYNTIPGRGLVTPTAISLRTAYLQSIGYSLNEIKNHSLDLDQIRNNIESFIGSVEIPLGIVGPLKFIDNEKEEMVYCPVGTLEGALVASMNRGAKAISLSGALRASVTHRKMLRAPVFTFQDAMHTAIFCEWMQLNFSRIKEEAEKYSNHADLLKIVPVVIDRCAHLRFIYITGDASGQNMTTTCTWHAILWIKENFEKATAITIEKFLVEGGGASDKKVSRYSIEEGRGINVTAECVLTEEVIRKILRTTPDEMFTAIENSKKICAHDGMVGFNINVANTIAGIFVATGQDLGSLHESGNGILEVKRTEEGLHLSLTLPTLVIGTVGGGTHLSKQKEALKIMNCYGVEKAERFAKMIAGFALALEISTTAAIVSGEFAKSHEKLGRNKPVKWLLRSDINKCFLKDQLLVNGKDLEILNVELSGIEMPDNGILMHITSKVVKKLIGFVPLRVTYIDKLSGILYEKTMLIKSKATDFEVVKGLHRMAASIDPLLSDLLISHKEHLEYKNSHLKEIEINRALHYADMKLTPEFFGGLVNEEREIFILLQEYLNPSELKIFNSENDPETWKEKNVEDAITAISQIHIFFLSEEKQALVPSAIRIESWKARPFYEKVIDVLCVEDESLRKNFHWVTDFLDNFEAISDSQNIPFTIIHNDFNPRNIAVRTDDSPCIYDWELAKKGIPHRDIVELLSFTLPDNFREEQFLHYLDHHYNMSFHKFCVNGDEWQKGYVDALKEYIVTRVCFYEAANILMKMQFSKRVLRNSLRMLDILIGEKTVLKAAGKEVVNKQK